MQQIFDDCRPKNKIETVFMNNHTFTNRGILENKEVEIEWWLILLIFPLGY